MYQNYKVLALIPARGGSKGIKNKNIRIASSRPLVDYSIQAAKQCKFIDDIVVSTDSRKIASVSKKCGSWVPFLRPEELATDTSKTIDAVVYTINKLKTIGKEYDVVILLQPTSPLRSSDDIKKAFELFIKTKKNLVSVNSIDINPLLYRTIDNHKLSRIVNASSTCRRQDLPQYYKVNGAIYINWVKTLNKNTSLNDNEIGYIMDESESLDIDKMEDLLKVRNVLNNIK